MAKKDAEKVTIRLFRGDKDRLAELFPTIGYNGVIRQLVRNFIKGVEEKAQRQAGNTPREIPTIDEELINDRDTSN